MTVSRTVELKIIEQQHCSAKLFLINFLGQKFY